MEQKLSVERKTKTKTKKVHHGEMPPGPSTRKGLPNPLGRHSLGAPGFEPSWVTSQLEALPAKLMLSSQLPHINKWTTMQIQALQPAGQIII